MEYWPSSLPTKLFLFSRCACALGSHPLWRQLQCLVSVLLRRGLARCSGCSSMQKAAQCTLVLSCRAFCTCYQISWLMSSWLVGSAFFWCGTRYYFTLGTVIKSLGWCLATRLVHRYYPSVPDSPQVFRGYCVQQSDLALLSLGRNALLASVRVVVASGFIYGNDAEEWDESRWESAVVPESCILDIGIHCGSEGVRSKRLGFVLLTCLVWQLQFPFGR